LKFAYFHLELVGGGVVSIVKVPRGLAISMSHFVILFFVSKSVTFFSKLGQTIGTILISKIVENNIIIIGVLEKNNH